jgi:hypothetical protein
LCATYYYLHTTSSVVADPDEVRTPKSIMEALELLLGQCAEIDKSVKYKRLLACEPKNKYYKEEYESSKARLQICVLRKHTEINKLVNEWEEAYKTEHEGAAPVSQDYTNPPISRLSKLREICETLFNHWKMNHFR